MILTEDVVINNQSHFDFVLNLTKVHKDVHKNINIQIQSSKRVEDHPAANVRSVHVLLLLSVVVHYKKVDVVDRVYIDGFHVRDLSFHNQRVQVFQSHD